MTFGAFSRVNLNNHNVTGLYASSQWNVGTSRDTAEYVQFVMTPSSGFRLTLEQITFDVSGSNGGPPANGQVEIFLGAGLTSKGSTLFSPTVVLPTFQNVSFNFTDFTSGGAESVTVRFYGWNASGGGDRMIFDNVAVSGSVVPVPEPVNAALAIFGICVAGFGIGRRVLVKARA